MLVLVHRLRGEMMRCESEGCSWYGWDGLDGFFCAGFWGTGRRIEGLKDMEIWIGEEGFWYGLGGVIGGI